MALRLLENSALLFVTRKLTSEETRTLVILTGIVVAFLLVLSWLIHSWSKSRRKSSEFSSLENELSNLDKMGKKGLLTPEEMKKVSQYMTKEFVDRQKDKDQLGKDLTAEQTLRTLADEIARKKDLDKDKDNQN